MAITKRERIKNDKKCSGWAKNEMCVCSKLEMPD
jgi:hypothetical protein